MTQDLALKVLMSGRNVFLTGPPGSGKTYLIKKFIDFAVNNNKTVAVTATTGVAATHLSGQTINSWAGIGHERALKAINRDALRRRFNTTDILIIDEISMMTPKTLALIDVIAKINRQNFKPLGGMQVILVGDFFQLPPVNKDKENKTFVYDSMVWSDLDLAVCYLDEQFRQQDEDDLTKVLKAIRQRTFGKIEQKIVSNRQNTDVKLTDTVSLFSHNYDVNNFNKQKFEELKGKARNYNSEAKGSSEAIKILRNSTLAPDRLELKNDCQVMFVVNNQKDGYVNGTRGKVVRLKNESIVIRTDDNKYIDLKKHRFELDPTLYGKASISQFPIKLAFGLTIHKSQGMTLDRAFIDLTHAFAPNMGYVALSRLTSINGLFLAGYNDMAFVIDYRIRDMDEYFKKKAKELHKNTG